MRKKRQQRRTTRNLSLPVWMKLHMDTSFKNDVEWMIEGAEICNADSGSLSVVLKGRPWKVTLQVKRIYDKKH